MEQEGKSGTLSSRHLFAHHTPLCRALTLRILLSHCLSIVEPPAALAVRYECGLTRGTEWRQQSIIAGKGEKKKSDTCTNAQEGKRRWMKASAAGPLAAVRHVGGGALFTVPCPTQSSKHLPSPWMLAPWLCGCWWAGWNDHGEWETQGNALDAAARWEDSLILDPSSSTDASDLLHRCTATEESLAVQTEGL